MYTHLIYIKKVSISYLGRSIRGIVLELALKLVAHRYQQISVDLLGRRTEHIKGKMNKITQVTTLSTKN